MEFRRLGIKVFFVFVNGSILLGANASLSQNSDSLSCVSKNMMTLKRPENAQFGSVDLHIDKNGQEVTHLQGHSDVLTYNTISKQFFWSSGSGEKTPVFFDKGEPYYYPTQSTVGRTGKTRLNIPLPVRSVILDVSKIGAEALKAKVDDCKQLVPFREQLQKPLQPIETQTCRGHLDKIKKLQVCVEKKNCPEVFNEVDAATPPRYSFTKLFESNTKMSDPEARVGVVLAADSAVSWAVPGAMLAQRASVGALAARAGMSFGSAFGLVNALLTVSTPVLMTVLDFDDCGDKGFQASGGASVEDCIGQNSVELQKKFSKDIMSAIENPDRFFADVASRPDGRLARLACYMFETRLNDWKKEMQDYKSPQCQGRTLQLKSGVSYLIGADSHLYRQESIDKAYHFYPQADTLVEDRTTGKKYPAVSVSQHFENDAVEKANRRRSREPSTEGIVPDRLLKEQALLQGYYPEYQNRISGGVCKTGERLGTDPATIKQ